MTGQTRKRREGSDRKMETVMKRWKGEQGIEVKDAMGEERGGKLPCVRGKGGEE